MKIKQTNFRKISKDFPLILASASPRRKRLLDQISLPFEVDVSNVDEGSLMKTPGNGTRDLALKKAEEVYSRHNGEWILGADTIVSLGQTVLGKPTDTNDARSMLERLSGKEHRVITGFAILDPTGSLAHSEEITTIVSFKKLSDQEIKDYIETKEPFGKARSYAIQGIGVFMVESISGSYTNVVGLPLCAVIKALVDIRALEQFPINL